MKHEKTILDEVMTPKALAAEIDAATDRNDHTGAVCLLADFCGGNFPKIAGAIRTIHDEVGSMPYPLLQYRDSFKKDMLKYVETHHGYDTYDIIRCAF